MGAQVTNIIRYTSAQAVCLTVFHLVPVFVCLFACIIDCYLIVIFLQTNYDSSQTTLYGHRIGGSVDALSRGAKSCSIRLLPVTRRLTPLPRPSSLYCCCDPGNHTVPAPPLKCLRKEIKILSHQAGAYLGKPSFKKKHFLKKNIHKPITHIHLCWTQIKESESGLTKYSCDLKYFKLLSDQSEYQINGVNDGLYWDFSGHPHLALNYQIFLVSSFCHIASDMSTMFGTYWK